LDSAISATPALPIVETVPDDDSVLAGDAACATSVDTASITTHRPVVWDIHVVNSDVPDAPVDPHFGKYFASSGFSRVHQLKEVDAATPDTDDMLFDGIDPRVMSMVVVSRNFCLFGVGLVEQHIAEPLLQLLILSSPQ
jgi:hypothetical protein